MINNRKKFRKFSGVMYIIASITLLLACIVSFLYESPYLPRRLFLRIPAFVVYTVLYFAFLLTVYPSVF